jgi:hypothetical protein
MTVRRFLPAALFVFAVLSSLPAVAGSSAGAVANQEDRRLGKIAREGIDSLLRAFDEFVSAIPQYALPEVNGRGDIIIRRKNLHPDMPPKTSSESHSTET